MFRTDRDALADKVDDLRADNERLRAQNDAMRTDLLAQRRAYPSALGTGKVYRVGPAHLTPGERAALSVHQLQPFPVWAAVLAHLGTFGMFSMVHFSMIHDKLPQAEADDPSGAKAIGFSFIPYFQLYWWVFNTLRLTDRLNLQLRLRDRPDAVPRGLMLACALIGAIPYVNIFIGVPVAWLVVVVYLQRAVNTLAALEREARAEHTAQAVAWPQLRVATVADLPGPSDVVADTAALEDDAAPARRQVL